MEKLKNSYDVAVIGGGLPGLALGILLAKERYRVVLFEKEKYPFQKVCGEYISFESWNFLEELGVPLSDWDLPTIDRLMVSSPGGNWMEQSLALGGFGISRYKLDSSLARIAKASGVELFEQEKVNDISGNGLCFNIKSAGQNVEARVVCGSFGKRSNLDIKWKREFTQRKGNKLNNYLGVKYHIRSNQPPGLIALHNFRDGYCGISAIEDNQYCLCYLTTAQNLRANGNSLQSMEKNVLQKNPFLQKIFSNATFLSPEPVVISQISFEKKKQVENNILFVGDAAGMIAPLCGNGMSMALRAAKLAFHCVDDFLQNKVSREQMEKNYLHQWKKLFSKRLRTGRIIQSFFGNERLSNLLITALRPLPNIVSYLVRQTHGEAF